MSLNLIINLQLFSEEKTEKATPKRRREAREKGQVLQSKEINSAIIIIVSFACLKILGGYMFNHLLSFSNNFYEDYFPNLDIFNTKDINILMMRLTSIIVIIVGPLTAIILLFGVSTSYLQVGFLFTTKALEFKLSRLNPIEGFKRIISKRSLVELVKSLFKIIVVGYLIYVYAIKEVYNIFKLMELNIESIATYIGNIVVNVGIRSGIALLVLAIFDYGYQWWDYEKNLKMSKQEIKEEFKQTEGNPQIKSKIREKQRQMAMRRMMQDVPKADVIITNPTHFAIALKYDKDMYGAPYVLAKGADLIAKNIKDIAKKHGIPTVENKPLAQTLYNTVEIGQIIPEELYQAVAEVLAYVYSLRY
ncbi:flagellar biosynthesis protein FlhB [Proteiniborus sp. MB09-C3]|uniref:flagellar biosynthesis protein FlhB n=1 Tax=Proteiniborus sp. MB09-C3 TaxID=3050072 RepID=UPI0025539836|nr:flagellar biosynthesis protein FlhB [Proteiniborus sp. MB09-C3]WIV10873.1 flagellar biosynthesis protein FlhB [Proteiniborus sp. MB09-C3]